MQDWRKRAIQQSSMIGIIAGLAKLGVQTGEPVKWLRIIDLLAHNTHFDENDNLTINVANTTLFPTLGETKIDESQE
jgi:hypothetical protein